jgi:mRNA interferase HicA
MRTAMVMGYWSTDVLYAEGVTSTELKRWLEKQGCAFQPAKGGHLKVTLGSKFTYLPMHGAKKDLGKGLVEAIK